MKVALICIFTNHLISTTRKYYAYEEYDRKSTRLYIRMHVRIAIKVIDHSNNNNAVLWFVSRSSIQFVFIHHIDI